MFPSIPRLATASIASLILVAGASFAQTSGTGTATPTSPNADTSSQPMNNDQRSGTTMRDSTTNSNADATVNSATRRDNRLDNPNMGDRTNRDASDANRINDLNNGTRSNRTSNTRDGRADRN